MSKFINFIFGDENAMCTKKTRIFYQGINSIGNFPDGRIKLDIHFKSESGLDFIWTPPWRAVIDLAASAKYLEETNKPKSEWNKELSSSYNKLVEVSEISKKFIDVARDISNIFYNIYGDVSIDRLFPDTPPEKGSKLEKIFFLLSNTKDLDDFIVKLNTIIRSHNRYLRYPGSIEKFNRIIKKLGLELDDNLIIVESKK